MKYCKKCGVLYASDLPCCPKCNPALDAEDDVRAPEPPAADRATVRRQWIALCIGIPAMIGVIYFVIWLFQKLSA